MKDRRVVRICHAGMEEAEVRRFEVFVRHVENVECRLVDEADADVAMIDTDGELGTYLVRAHRMLFTRGPHPRVGGQRIRGLILHPVTVWGSSIHPPPVLPC